MKVLNLEIITDYAPTQMEGITDDNRPVYARYRGGWLSVEIGLPGEKNDLMVNGFTVFEDKIISESGSAEAISVLEIKKILSVIDLGHKLYELEQDKKRYRQNWTRMFESIEEYEVKGIKVLRLSIPGKPPWVTPYANRVGRFDFENELAAKMGSGVLVYFHTSEQENQPGITVLVTENFKFLEPMKLVEIGSKAFGNMVSGVTGGEYRGEATCLASGDQNEAFELIVQAISNSVIERGTGT